METPKTQSIADIGMSLTPDAIDVVRQIVIPSYGSDIQELTEDPVLKRLKRTAASRFFEVAYSIVQQPSRIEYARNLRQLILPTLTLARGLAARSSEVRGGVIDHLERQVQMTIQERELLYKMGGTIPTKRQEQWWSGAFWTALFEDGSY